MKFLLYYIDVLQLLISGFVLLYLRINFQKMARGIPSYLPCQRGCRRQAQSDPWEYKIHQLAQWCTQVSHTIQHQLLIIQMIF